jgi:hypothetical protein
MMRRIFLFALLCSTTFHSGFSQQKDVSGNRILFQGLVMDASTLSPISNSQILINRAFTSVSDKNGTFAFYVNRNDTVIFKSLGYKSTILFISDTLSGREFMAGIYMKSDTVSIGEVIIIPRVSNLKSDIMNSRSKTPANFDNAKYNVAISAYQGRTTTGQGTSNDPAYSYSVLSQKQRINAYGKGQIPSDQIFGANALLLIPAAILYFRGLPEKPSQMNSDLTKDELDMLQKRYFETLKQRK